MKTSDERREYRRQWQYRKRHGLMKEDIVPTKEQVKEMPRQIIRNARNKSLIENEVGNGKWKELEQKEVEWQQNHDTSKIT